MPQLLHPIFEDIADAICPPLDDEGRLGKHRDSPEEIHAAPADDLISRLDLLRELDERIAFWTQHLNPRGAWYQGDLVKLGSLRQLREFVMAMEAA